MTSNSRVAVVSTVLNERNGIAELLDGFLRQTRTPDEIVVVDGGSTDGTLDVLQSYAERHAAVVVMVQPGVNIARGRNIAIARANSDIVAVTDGGCRPEPDWLQRLVQPLLEERTYGAVTGARHVVHRNLFEQCAGVLSTSTNAPDEAGRVFHGRNSAFRKSVWLEVGGYPEWLYTAEDTLFAQRAKALGCRVALAEDAVVHWRPRPTLRKLAKQYFLYGRGTGRIGQADPATVRWHLRNHLAWMAALLAAVLWPWVITVALGILAWMWVSLVTPALRQVSDRLPKGVRATACAGCIVLVRSLANNMGQWVGHREYLGPGGFRDALERYRRGAWRHGGA